MEDVFCFSSYSGKISTYTHVILLFAYNAINYRMPRFDHDTLMSSSYIVRAVIPGGMVQIVISR